MAAGLTIGNFDGVHRGHATLVRAARETVGKQGRVIAVTFEPHPMRVLQPDTAPPRLSTSEQRREWLLEAGADEVVVLESSMEFLRLEPDGFLKMIVDRFRPEVIVEGKDFRFGRRRAGDTALLESMGDSLGYRTLLVSPVEVALSDQSVVAASSSIARWLIERGRVRDAGLVLGREFEIRGRVVKGDQRGRTIGFPTANLEIADQMLPGDGVYAGWGTRRGVWMPAAISVGDKPTFDGSVRVCEAYLLGDAGPVGEYGWPIQLRFTEWLRDQVRYDSVTDLISQLHRDVNRVAELSAFPAGAMEATT